MSGTRSVEAARRAYAEELRFTVRIKSPQLHAAFASVPRERFVGPGPWLIKSNWHIGDYWTTDEADPRDVYHDVLIALDAERGLNNGQPSLWAFVLDRLAVVANETLVHLGCGTGYYTAILAELVGPGGRIRAIELHEGLAAKAREALKPWRQVEVFNTDGSTAALGSTDVIVASAGATHPAGAWLDALTPGGRLLLPMTPSKGPGGMLLATRRPEGFAAQILGPVAFVDFVGARDDDTDAALAEAFRKGDGQSVRSLRRDAHAEDESCWLHGDGWCLSRRELQ